MNFVNSCLHEVYYGMIDPTVFLDYDLLILFIYKVVQI